MYFYTKIVYLNIFFTCFTANAVIKYVRNPKLIHTFKDVHQDKYCLYGRSWDIGIIALNKHDDLYMQINITYTISQSFMRLLYTLICEKTSFKKKENVQLNPFRSRIVDPYAHSIDQFQPVHQSKNTDIRLSSKCDLNYSNYRWGLAKDRLKGDFHLCKVMRGDNPDMFSYVNVVHLNKLIININTAFFSYDATKIFIVTSDGKLYVIDLMRNIEQFYLFKNYYDIQLNYL